jgi:ketosteroid isomerase-like protein
MRVRHIEFLATRGDGFALGRVALKSVELDYDSEFVGVWEVGDGGLLSRFICYDSDDLDAAFAELDERFADTDPENAAVWRPGAAAIRALNARDWEAWASAGSSDFVFVDHTPVGAGTIRGISAGLLTFQSMVDVIPDAVVRVVSVEAICAAGCLVRVQIRGTNDEGGEVEFSSYAVVLMADGLATRVEDFPIEQRAEALRRFVELTAPSAPSALETRTTAAVRRFFENWEREDWDGVADFFAPDCRWEDLRAGLVNVYNGRDESVEYVRTADTLFGGLRVRSLEFCALRGAALALGRMLVASPDDANEVEFLGV